MFSESLVIEIERKSKENADSSFFELNCGPVLFFVSRKPLPEESTHHFQGHIICDGAPLFIYLE